MAEREELNVLRWISQEYFDLNGSHYDTWKGLPTSLEFSQLVRIGRPVLIKGTPIPEMTSKWTDEYLVQRSGDNQLSIAVTPNGRADAVTPGPNDNLYFVEPYTEKLTMETFLSKLSSSGVDAKESRGVYYLQSQNGNLYSSEPSQASEFPVLRSDIPDDLPFCSEALGSPPEAVNLWIGDEGSITSIHSDPYENIYTVIRGQKIFTLFPPTDGWCMKEHTYPHAQYTRSSVTNQLVITPSSSDVPQIRWSSIIDPDDEAEMHPDAHPIHITVSAGESLYLPSGWWHYVRQSGLTIAVNYWYDMESRGMPWVWLNLLRGIKEPLAANGVQNSESQCDSEEALLDNYSAE
ncbi:tRNA wybutosine-synthesizing protein 4 [Abortiporus biennis]